MPRLQLPAKIQTLLMTISLVTTSVIAQSGNSTVFGTDLPCREVVPGDNVDTCYTLYRSTTTDSRKAYDDAEKTCRRKHGSKGRLATIPDRNTQNWLEEILNEQYNTNSGQLWIGAKYINNEWTWHGDGIFFTNWAAGQPMNDPSRKAYIETHRSASGETSWKWKTDSGASVKDFLCEYLDNRCGRPYYEPSIKNRVAGGTEAASHSWPWMVSIQNSREHVCGGSLLSENMILTAAHCLDGFFLDRERVVMLGMHNLRDIRPDYTIEAHVSNVWKNPNYGKNLTNSNDLMLIELEEPITFNHGVKPVCLPRRNQTYPQTRNCIATGWGMHNDTSQCCPMWVAQRDTEQIDAVNVTLKRFNTLYQCQYQCFHTKGCVGVNFHYSKPRGPRCIALMSASSQSYRTVVGVDHYSIRRNCAGCMHIWTVYENRAVMSNLVESFAFDVESQYDCQLNCSDVEGCSGFNYRDLASVNLPNRCELLFRGNLSDSFPREDMYTDDGTNHYEVTKFFLQDYDYNLRQVILPIVSKDQCKALYRDTIDESMMCAGKLRGGADTCKGDSGGPLVCEEPDGRWTVYGVTSWGDPECGLGNKPGVYALVAPHRAWIERKLRESSEGRPPTTTPGPSVEMTSEEYSCNSNDPCTPENVEAGWRCYTASDPNPNKFIFCTTRARCLQKDGSTMTLSLEEDLCYFIIRRMRDIAKSESGTSGFRIKIEDRTAG